MLTYLLIGLGGALGSVGRYWLSLTIATRFESPFPWGTFLVNVTGCFAIGLFAFYPAQGARWLGSRDAQLFLLTGVCGGYTTFSAFSLQTLTLMRAGDVTRAGAYIGASIICCLAGTWLGLLLGSSLTTAR